MSLEEGPRNAGFEVGTLDWWGVFSEGAGFRPAATRSKVRSGAFSLAEADPGGIVYQNVGGLTPGKTYMVSSWLAGSDGATARGELSVHNTEGRNFSQTMLTPAATWQRLLLLYVADSTGSVRIHLVRHSGTGTLYWDDVSLEEGPRNAGLVRGHGRHDTFAQFMAEGRAESDAEVRVTYLLDDGRTFSKPQGSSRLPRRGHPRNAAIRGDPRVSGALDESP